MKLKYLVGFLIFILLIASASSRAGDVTVANNKTVKIKCTEMSCAGCKKKITQSINNLEGIKKIKVNLETKIITVTFDESLTSAAKIVDAIAAAGYESELIE